MKNVTPRRPRLPEKVDEDSITVRWLIDHIPIKMWVAIFTASVTLAASLFSVGVWVGRRSINPTPGSVSEQSTDRKTGEARVVLLPGDLEVRAETGIGPVSLQVVEIVAEVRRGTVSFRRMGEVAKQSIDSTYLSAVGPIRLVSIVPEKPTLAAGDAPMKLRLEFDTSNLIAAPLSRHTLPTSRVAVGNVRVNLYFEDEAIQGGGATLQSVTVPIYMSAYPST